MCSESPSTKRQLQRIASFTVVFLITFSLTIVEIYKDHASQDLNPIKSDQKPSLMNTRENGFTNPPRKLLNTHAGSQSGAAKVEPKRMWSEKCSKSDIVISQGTTAPLPNGIPTYTVEIMNVCVSGCPISAIHVNCGWFSSARVVNPRVFKRLGFNDCLVNDGKPLANGRTLSFQYANTFRYPLSVASIKC